MKKTLLLLTMMLIGLYASAQYVDLGLPSGTLWNSQNEDGRYAQDVAFNRFGNNMPSVRQFQELIDNCSWQWTGSGYMVIGRNGNRIYLPAEGYCTSDGETRREGVSGCYWSSEITYRSDDKDSAGCLTFTNDNISIFNFYVGAKRSVRLVR